MAQQLGGTPVLVLKEGSERKRGKDAQSRNILAAKAISSAVKSTLGPKGMDKMMVNSVGDVIITNDGATILKEMDTEHPVAKMMVEIAKTQDEEVGDGTTAAVVTAGELLKRAEDLLDQEVHPTLIVSGYRLAAEKASEILNKIARDISPDDFGTLKKIALTSMTGKGAGTAKEVLTNLAVDAVRTIAEDGLKKIDIDHIKLEKKTGGSTKDTKLIRGMVVDKGRAHPGMPKRVENAKISLVNTALEIKKTEVETEIEITSPDQMKTFLDEEEKMLGEMVKAVKESGANVLFCQKGIDDLAQHYLAKEGILAVKRVNESARDRIALKLRDYASSVGGREQLAIQAFADAIEIIPRALAENAGLDPIDMLVELRSAHEAGNTYAGLDVFKGRATDMLKAGVIEPLRIKTQAISSATESATMVLRIDDVIVSRAKEKPPEGGYPGMGMGMGGEY